MKSNFSLHDFIRSLLTDVFFVIGHFLKEVKLNIHQKVHKQALSHSLTKAFSGDFTLLILPKACFWLKLDMYKNCCYIGREQNMLQRLFLHSLLIVKTSVERKSFPHSKKLLGCFSPQCCGRASGFCLHSLGTELFCSQVQTRHSQAGLPQF